MPNNSGRLRKISFNRLYVDLNNDSEETPSWNRELTSIKELGVKEIEITATRLNKGILAFLDSLMNDYKVILRTAGIPPMDYLEKVSLLTADLMFIKANTGLELFDSLIYDCLITPKTLDNFEDFFKEISSLLGSGLRIRFNIKHFRHKLDTSQLRLEFNSGSGDFWMPVDKHINLLNDFLKELRALKEEYGDLVETQLTDYNAATIIANKGTCLADKNTLSVDSRGNLKLCPDYKGSACKSFRLATLPAMVDDFIRARETDLNYCYGCVFYER